MATHGVTKWLNKARRISNAMSDLKEEDREEWTRELTGPRHDLKDYLSMRKRRETVAQRISGLGETSEKQYRTRARERVARIDVIEAEELLSRQQQAREEQRRQRWIDPVWRAELARDLREEHAGTYEEDIETRLERGGLNIEAIEMADLESRAGLYAMRRSLAQEMLEDPHRVRRWAIPPPLPAHLQRIRRGAIPPPQPPEMRRRGRVPYGEARAHARVAAAAASIAQRLAETELFEEAGQGLRYKHKKSRRIKKKREKKKSRKNK